MSRPGWVTYIRDTITFVLGLVIISIQAGIPPFAPPPNGPSIELLAIGALCCNVPGIIQVIQWRTIGGTSSSPPPPAPSGSPSPSAAPSPVAGE